MKPSIFRNQKLAMRTYLLRSCYKKSIKKYNNSCTNGKIIDAPVNYNLVKYAQVWYLQT
jgi:hypothetical protein